MYILISKLSCFCSDILFANTKNVELENVIETYESNYSFWIAFKFFERMLIMRFHINVEKTLKKRQLFSRHEHNSTLN